MSQLSIIWSVPLLEVAYYAENVSNSGDVAFETPAAAKASERIRARSKTKLKFLRAEGVCC